jgi:rhodanese-related sulfurtransferase
MADRDAHSRRTVFFAIATLLVLAIILVAQFRGSARSVSAYEAREILSRDSGVVLLDVRTPEEFFGETGHLERAFLIPVQDLERRIGELLPWRSRTIIVYCRSGRRSRNAVTLLAREGYRALNLEGGIIEWHNQKYPVLIERVK